MRRSAAATAGFGGYKWGYLDAATGLRQPSRYAAAVMACLPRIVFPKDDHASDGENVNPKKASVEIAITTGRKKIIANDVAIYRQEARNYGD